MEEQIARGEHATSSDDARDPIRRDRAARERVGALRRLFEEAEASGITASSVGSYRLSRRAKAERGLRRLDVGSHVVLSRETRSSVLMLAVLHRRMRPDLHL